MTTRQPSRPPEIEGFRHVELLGMGGFADVFKYEQLGLRRSVAIKVLLHGLGDAAQRSFEAEANLMAQLSNHPSIVSIYGAGAAPDGRPYLVMEYCPPPHLAVRIKSRPLSVAKALEIGVQVASAVEMAHRLGILHRDIKPANILFTEFGRPALTDFGISSSSMGGTQGHGQGMSVPWAPPEQLTAGQPMGPASDVYSLAATLWTTLTQHSPFEVPGGPNDPYAMSRRIKSDPPPATGRADVPESLERVLRTAMAKNPDLRYQSALEFARALQGVQAELHQSVTPIDVREDRAPEEFLSVPEDPGTRLSSYVAIDPDAPPTGALPVGYSAATAQPSLWAIGASSPSGLTNQSPGWSGIDAVSPPPVLQHGRGSVAVQPPREFTSAALPAPDEPVRHPVGEDAALNLAAGAAATPPGADTGAGKRRSTRVLVGVLVGVLVVGTGSLAGYRLINAAPAVRAQTPEPTAADAPLDPVGEVVPTPVGLTVEPLGDQVRAGWENPEPRDGDSYVWTVLDPAVDPVATATKDLSVTVPSLRGQTCVEVRLVRRNGRFSEPARGCTP